MGFSELFIGRVADIGRFAASFGAFLAIKTELFTPRSSGALPRLPAFLLFHAYPRLHSSGVGGYLTSMTIESSSIKLSGQRALTSPRRPAVERGGNRQTQAARLAGQEVNR